MSEVDEDESDRKSFPYFRNDFDDVTENDVTAGVDGCDGECDGGNSEDGEDGEEDVVDDCV